MLNSPSLVGSDRILIVTPQPFYEDRGTPIAVRYVAQALSELGAKVDVLAFPLGAEVSIPNVRVARSANPLHLHGVPIGFSWRKIALDASLWQSFSRRVRSGRYALVHAVEEAAYMAAMICPHLGVPFIYDMASAIPVEMSRKRLFDVSWIRAALSRIEQHVIGAASRVVCSSGLADHVIRQVPQANVREWLYPAFTQPAAAAAAERLRAELGLQRAQRVVLYSGNLAGYQGMALLLDAFERARHIRPELVLVCVGATPRDLAGKGRREYLDRPHVHVVARQPRSKMPDYLRLADFLVLPRVAAENVPLKLFDYMAAGKPIIATRGPAHEPLLDSTRAFMSDPNAQSFAAALLRACESPARAALLAAAAQSYACRHFGWERFVEFVRFTYCDALGEVRELKRLLA